MQLRQFKVRASAVSQIMTNPRSKSETLSETCKTYLDTWIKEQLYETKKEIKSKYLTKGIDVEDEAIEYYAEQRNLGFVLKNTDYFEDDYFCGTPDMITHDILYEFKSSWDCFTFPLFQSEIDKTYYQQVQIYLHLTGLKKGVLAYTLQNTPDELQWDEPKDYSNLPSYLRIKEFFVDYDVKYIDQVKQRVIECRNYIESVINQQTWK